MDRLGDRAFADVRFQIFARDDMNRPVEQAGNEVFQADMLVDAYILAGIDLDHDVGIAVRPRVAAGARAKKRRCVTPWARKAASFSLSFAMVSAAFMFFLYHKTGTPLKWPHRAAVRPGPGARFRRRLDVFTAEGRFGKNFS